MGATGGTRAAPLKRVAIGTPTLGDVLQRLRRGQPVSFADAEIILVPALFLVAAFGVLGKGAFFWPQAAPVAAIAVTLALTASRGFRSSGIALAGFGLLLAGLAASSVVNGWSLTQRLSFATLLTAFGGLVTALRVAERGERGHVLDGLCLIGSASAVLGMIGVAWHVFPLAMQSQDLWRAATTITYSNAAGSLFALTLPAAVVRRNATAFVLILTGLLVSLSRGGLLAAAVALGVLLIAGERRSLAAMTLPAIGAVVAFAGFLPSVAGPAQPWLAAATTGAGIAMAWWTPSRRARRAIVIGTALLVVGGTAYGALVSSDVVAKRIGGSSDTRVRTWRAALDTFHRSRVFGSGPGTFRVSEIVDGREEATAFAHNEYLQALAETGIVGLATVLGALACFAWACVRVRPPPGSDHRLVWAAAVGAGLGFLIHGAVDFVWHVPVLVFIAFAWAGIAMATGGAARSPAR